jgi:2-haloacid dehalogenase
VKPELANVKALVFDAFGTVVDWRGSVIAEGMAWGKAKGLNINWVDFADRWRLGYKPTMDKVRKGEIPWTRLDDLHRMILEELLKEFKIEGLTEEEKVSWTHVWRRLKPWPDSVEGLTRIKKKYVIAPLGNTALMTNLAKFGTCRWTPFRAPNYSNRKTNYTSPQYYLDSAGERRCAKPTSSDWQAALMVSVQDSSIGPTNTAMDRSACQTRLNQEILTRFP